MLCAGAHNELNAHELNLGISIRREHGPQQRHSPVTAATPQAVSGRLWHWMAARWGLWPWCLGSGPALPKVHSPGSSLPFTCAAKFVTAHHALIGFAELEYVFVTIWSKILHLVSGGLGFIFLFPWLSAKNHCPYLRKTLAKSLSSLLLCEEWQKTPCN